MPRIGRRPGEKPMASLLSTMTTVIGRLPERVKVEIYRMADAAPERGMSVIVDGVSNYEARSIIDHVIRLEQARGEREVLTPTKYGNRFSGLDLDGDSK